MLSYVNESQRDAINYWPGNLLIVAGPGTGKTHTLTHRIAKLSQCLLENQKALAITFTNKAAREMRERLNACGCGSAITFVGTFHQFCLQCLLRFLEHTALPKGFRVATPEEIQELSKDWWKDFSQRQRKDFLEEIWRLKTLQTDSRKSTTLDGYNEFLRQNKCLDFDDLLLETVLLLANHASVLQQIQRDYPLIFVDEYQDINPIQHDLLKILVKDDIHITAIGDPNQAIYGFRGASNEFFQMFVRDFLNVTVMSLNENYRSSVNLLKASTQVIAASGAEIAPLTAKIFVEGRLIFYEAATDKGEAEYVVHQIEKLVGGTSMFSQDSGRVDTVSEAQYSFGDMAILYRLKGQRPALEEALKRSGIPYQLSQKQEDLVDEPPDMVGEKVNLLTLHASKGLEFPVVFIVGCEETLLPLEMEGLVSDTQEERRVFYVGMTRARERLFLTRAKRRFLFGKTYHNQPSRFLFDIEEQLKAYESAQKQKRRKGHVKGSEDQMTLF